MGEELEHAMAMGHASAPPADNSQSHIPGQSRLHFPNHFPQRAQRMQGMPCGDPDLRPWSAAKASVSLQHKWAGPPPATPALPGVQGALISKHAYLDRMPAQ